MPIKKRGFFAKLSGGILGVVGGLLGAAFAPVILGVVMAKSFWEEGTKEKKAWPIKLGKSAVGFLLWSAIGLVMAIPLVFVAPVQAAIAGGIKGIGGIKEVARMYVQGEAWEVDDYVKDVWSHRKNEFPAEISDTAFPQQRNSASTTIEQSERLEAATEELANKESPADDSVKPAVGTQPIIISPVYSKVEPEPSEKPASKPDASSKKIRSDLPKT